MSKKYPQIPIADFYPINEQVCTVGKHEWAVARIIALSQDLPVMEVPLACINIWHQYERMNLRDFVMHIKAVMDADLNYPIILDEDGELMDGRHRIMKALYLGKTTIKVVRFLHNPAPCRVHTSENKD